MCYNMHKNAHTFAYIVYMMIVYLYAYAVALIMYRNNTNISSLITQL